MGSNNASSLKPEKFRGSKFDKWQEHLEDWFIILDLISAIEKDLPYHSKGFSSESSYSKSIVDKSLEEIEFYCRFRILSYLLDELHKTYIKYKTAKDLWYALEDAYIGDNESSILTTIK